MRIVPPPSTPLASSAAPASLIALPVTSIVPPCPFFAVLCLGGRGGQPAGDGHRATLPAPEHDGAGSSADRPGFGRAGQVDGVAGDGARCRRLHLDPAAFGANRPGIRDQRRIARPVRGHRDLKKAVAGQIERRRFAGAEADLAHRHADGAGIVDAAAQECRIATLADLDRALVDHGGRGSGAGEAAPAGDKVGVGRVQRRGDEALGAHDARRRDRDAVRVDEVDLAVGVERAGDGRGGRSLDAVEEDGRGRWLLDLDA